MAGSDPVGVTDFADLLRGANRAVVFTGAGISTESGIPDFRSPGGIWTKMAPIDFRRFRRLRRDAPRGLAPPLRDGRDVRRRRAQCRPSRRGRAGGARHASATSSPRTSTICTRTRACRTGKVIELHGNTRYAKCLDCGARAWSWSRSAPISSPWRRAGLRRLRRHREDGHDLLRPGHAGSGDGPRRTGHARPAIFSSCWVPRWWYIRRPDFPLLAARNGARLVIVNREPTELDARGRSGAASRRSARPLECRRS